MAIIMKEAKTRANLEVVDISFSLTDKDYRNLLRLMEADKTLYLDQIEDMLWVEMRRRIKILDGRIH